MIQISEGYIIALLIAFITLQAWQIRQIFNLKSSLAVDGEKIKKYSPEKCVMQDNSIKDLDKKFNTLQKQNIETEKELKGINEQMFSILELLKNQNEEISSIKEILFKHKKGVNRNGNSKKNSLVNRKTQKK